jgi:hypothetical protein
MAASVTLNATTIEGQLMELVTAICEPNYVLDIYQI